MPKRIVLVEIDCEVRLVTAAAIKIFDGKREVWVPKSQITDWTDGPDDAPGFGTTSIFVPEWLAIEKDLV
jgi:hypothetical protein